MFYLPPWNVIKSDTFLLGWNLGGAFTILLPLLMMIFSRAIVVGDGEGNDGNNNNDNNNDGNNNNGRWWQWRNRNNNGEDGEQRSNDGAPWWWFNGRSGDPENEGQGAIGFVYVYALVLFVGLTLFGNHAIARSGDSSSNYGSFQAALFMFTNFAFLAMILIAGTGMIRVEGRELEENGWYGQMSVCAFLTCLFWWIHGMIYSWWLRKRIQAAAAAASSSGSNFFTSTPTVNNDNNNKSISDYYTGIYS